MRYEATADADVMQVSVDGPFCDAPRQVMATSEAQTDLASALMAIPGVVELFFLDATVSIQKAPDASWQQIMPTVQESLERHELSA